jgi:L-ascorbate metabolism protein UlaG (beta-lactamase superfamily)
MKIVHRANTCFSIFYDQYHILFDPWLNGPAVAQGWTQFPPATKNIEDLPKPDLVYISHIHSDHCETTTLDGIDKGTPIVIMDLPPNFLHKMLLSKGFNNIFSLKSGKLHKLNTFKNLGFEVFGAGGHHIASNVIDSGLILKIEDTVIVNFNDNHPTEDQCRSIKKKYPNIDVAFVPDGGGSGYPAMYENLSFEEKNEIFNQTMDQFNAAFTKALDILEPKTAIPVAGGFAIRGNHPIETNYLQVRHLDQTNVVNYYRVNSHSKNQSNIFPMQPDMELDVNKHQLISKSYKPWSKEQLDIFFKKIAREEITTNVLTSSKAPGFIKMLKSARNNMWKAQKSYNFFPNYRVYLFEDHYSSLYEIEMKENILIEVQEINNSLPYLKISAGQDTYLEWLMGYEDFNMLDSGHRLKFFREPNIYEVEVYFLLSLFRL